MQFRWEIYSKEFPPHEMYGKSVARIIVYADFKVDLDNDPVAVCETYDVQKEWYAEFMSGDRETMLTHRYGEREAHYSPEEVGAKAVDALPSPKDLKLPKEAFDEWFDKVEKKYMFAQRFKERISNDS